MSILGYLAKLKRSLGLAFGVHFLHDFSIKMFHVCPNVTPYFFLEI